MPPMILDDHESLLSRQSSPDVFYDPSSQVSTSFKHPIIDSGSIEKRRSSIVIAIPARSQPKLGKPQISRSIESHRGTAAEESSSDELQRFSRPAVVRAKSDLSREALTAEISTRSPPTNSEKEVHPSISSIYPKSRSTSFVPPLPLCKERVAVRDLLAQIDHQNVEQRAGSPSIASSSGGTDFFEFELSDFSIYLPDNKHHPFELRGLQHLATRFGHSSFLFDGVLSVGNERRYVNAVPFKICSIGNYGEDLHDVGSNIWLQSDLNTKSDIYYRLNTPSSEYVRYHDGFVWLANLAKHFVDYCQASEQPVSIHNFSANFAHWIKDHHEDSPAFQHWYQQYGKDDFRRQIAANIKFLFKESVGVNDDLRSEFIFNETMERNSIPMQKLEEDKTIVTPFVYECFKDVKFGHHLKMMDPSGSSKAQQISQGEHLDLTVDEDLLQSRINDCSSITAPQSRNNKRQKFIRSIKVGDVLSVTKDREGSLWKDEVSRWKAVDHCWYIYVQAVQKVADGTRAFDGIWLYKPSDTCCAKMKYPFQNEMFLSDNCTCEVKSITEEEVLGIEKVVWNGHPSEGDQRFFIRQTYLDCERFVTLKDSHKKCEHLRAHDVRESSMTVPKYQIGQTVLVLPRHKSKYGLEPFEIVDFTTDGPRELVVLRRLLRRHAIDGKGSPNELVYTEKVDILPAGKIDGTCLVRFYKESDIIDHLIPPPYNRDGIGNAFYITTRLVEVNGVDLLKPIERNIPAISIQGFNPLEIDRKLLRGMDLYCGGGNFGRSLEEGGAVHNEWAVDINQNAIHTYAANLRNPQATKVFYGSVNDMLAQAMRGNPRNSDLIPSPGDVDFISAGSPCQGFSVLNSSRNNEQGLRNQSLVASVAAYVDFYRPKYGVLENVMTMAQKGRGRDQDILSQLICAIVGLGYQLQLFVVDAWSCGMPQSRTRLFVSFAARGLEPLEHPRLSHSHPPHKAQDRSLGIMANGQPFGKRLHRPTPFEYVSAAKAVGDLPNIGDGHTYQCVEQPEHVMPITLTTAVRAQIEAIPTQPRGMNFSKAWNEGRGVMTQEQVAAFPMKNKDGLLRETCRLGSVAWGRIRPNGLIPTILVSLLCQDSRSGTTLHWDDNRVLTTMEAKRAQGFLDDEILLGTPGEGWRILGNSVPRGVALALGLSLREAWMKNAPDAPSMPVASIFDVPMINVRETSTKRRKVSPNKARRSKHVADTDDENSQDQEDPTNHTLSKEDLAYPSSEDVLTAVPLKKASTSGPQTVAPREGRRSRVIPDFRESSADEADLSEGTFNRFVSFLALREKSGIISGSGISSDANDQSKERSLKRSRATLQETKILPSEKTYKVPRVELHSSPTSRPQSTQHQSHTSRTGLISQSMKSKPLNASALAGRLLHLELNGVPQNQESFVDGGDDSSGSNDDIKLIAASAFKPGPSINHTTMRKNMTQSRGIQPAAPKPATIINLASDDEDGDEEPFKGFPDSPIL